MKKFKKGFTIVELVIVIAVIAVLTAVLVPTFIHLTNKANKASDQSLVTNLNKALAMRRGEGKEAPKTMHDAVKGLEEYGYGVEKLVTKSGEKLVYDLKEDKFYLDGESFENPYSSSVKDQIHYLWRIQDSVAKDAEAAYSYSVYASQNFVEPTDGVKVSVGFDAGDQSISKVTYSNTGAAQDVVIRTNGGSLTITAPADTVNHYGEASVVSVKKAATESYHLFGEITVKMTVEDGRAVVEKGGKVATLEVAKGAQEIVAATGSKVENLSIASDADIQSAKLQVESGSEVNVVVNNSSTVDTTAIAEAGVKVVETQSEAAQGKAAINIGTGAYITNLGSITSSGDYLLLGDYNGPIVPGLFATRITLDLNGYTVTSSDTLRGVLNAARAGNYFEVKGNGKLIQTSEASNAPAIISKGQDVTIGAGVQVEGGAVGVWLESNKTATINFAGSYKTTLAGSFGFYRNGNYQDVSKCPVVNIKKTAKIEVSQGAAIYAAGYAVWNIEGGEFTSNECLEFKSGVVTIQDGTFKTTASSKTHVPYSNGTSANGYALAIVWNDDYAKPLTVTLNGGKFVGPLALLCDEEDLSKVNNVVLNNNIGVAIEHEPQ